jgi:hypothetical protein
VSAVEQPAPMATVGSSDVASILGYAHHDASPWKTWARLVGVVERYDSRPDDPEAAAGRMFEPAIGLRYAAERNLSVGTELVMGPPIGHPPLIGPEPWMSARPDFIVGRFTDRWMPVKTVEAKAPRAFDPHDDEGRVLWGEPGTDQLPRFYLVQVIWQMAVTNVGEADLAAFARISSEWRVYHIERREALVQRIVTTVRNWYERHVVEGNPPPIDGSAACGDVLAKLYPAKAGKVWKDPEPIDLALARDIAGLKAQIAKLKKKHDRKVHQLEERIGEAYGIRDVARWSPVAGRRTVDGEALRRAHPDIAAKFTHTGEPTRRFALLSTLEDPPEDTP